MLNFIITELGRDLGKVPVWINFGITFSEFGVLMFLFTLVMRGFFVYKDSYIIAMRIAIVVVCFGGELIMTYYPHIFMIHMANILFAVGGALFGKVVAEKSNQYTKRRLSAVEGTLNKRL